MKILSYLLSIIFALVFYILLLAFHILQWIAFYVFGKNAHQKVVDIMCWCLVKSLLILGNRIKLINQHKLPKNTNLLFVANHQSIFDIPPIIWYFRKHYPKFVSKKELGKGIPSVSFNLRHGGAVLIDRKDAKQALNELEKFAVRIHKNGWSVAIFPEGTRSRTGIPKSFAPNGLKMLIKHNPNAYVVPISINNSWKIFRYGKFPLGIFNCITLDVHQPFKVNSLPFDELLKKVEITVKSAIQK
ncbi:MAG: lysophospholipid acyltransferase family protein [Tenacibaculum sp.]